MRQPMSNGLAVLTHWSVRQKLNRVSLVQFGLVIGCLHDPANAQQTFTCISNTVNLLEVCCTFAESSKHPITSLGTSGVAKGGPGIPAPNPPDKT